jgi:hypothetical protein
MKVLFGFVFMSLLASTASFADIVCTSNYGGGCQAWTENGPF